MGAEPIGGPDATALLQMPLEQRRREWAIEESCEFDSDRAGRARLGMLQHRGVIWLQAAERGLHVQRLSDRRSLDERLWLPEWTWCRTHALGAATCDGCIRAAVQTRLDAYCHAVRGMDPKPAHAHCHNCGAVGRVEADATCACCGRAV